jgi:hypothetical protein
VFVIGIVEFGCETSESRVKIEIEFRGEILV